MRVRVPSAGTVALAEFGPHSAIDHRIVAGTAGAVQDGDLPTDLAIDVATGTAWYEQYRREYEQFLATDLRRQDWTQPEAAESLTHAVADKCLQTA